MCGEHGILDSVCACNVFEPVKGKTLNRFKYSAELKGVPVVPNSKFVDVKNYAKSVTELPPDTYLPLEATRTMTVQIFDVPTKQPCTAEAIREVFVDVLANVKYDETVQSSSALKDEEELPDLE